MMPRTSTAVWAAIAACALACGPPKSAEDPRAFMDAEFEDEAPVDWQAATASDDAVDEVQPRATRAMCRSAAMRLETLAYEGLLATESDRRRRKLLEQRKAGWLRSETVQRRVQEVTRACLDRKTSKSEALCIANADSGEAIETCEQ